MHSNNPIDISMDYVGHIGRRRFNNFSSNFYQPAALDNHFIGYFIYDKILVQDIDGDTVMTDREIFNLTIIYCDESPPQISVQYNT